MTTRSPNLLASNSSSGSNRITNNGNDAYPQRNEDSNIAIIVPRGCKIRDEFVCPITRELITDPVIAADGHTYDRAAIEQWIHGSFSASTRGSTSPKTGQLLDHLHLIPNHNLKRLLKDMIKEGGEALYYRDDSTNSCTPNNTNSSKTSTLVNLSSETKQTTRGILSSEKLTQSSLSRTDNSTPLISEHTSDNQQLLDEVTEQGTLSCPNINYRNNTIDSPTAGPRIVLVHAKVLYCRCLGPPESDWNNRSFRLRESSSESLLGGRRRPHEHTAQNFVQFTDATVSRRHFEIRFHNGTFQLRDLGSAGGSFVRIPARCGVALKEGTMIMLGKHQLVALGHNSDLNNNNMENNSNSATAGESEEKETEAEHSFLLIDGYRARASNEDEQDDGEAEVTSDVTDDASRNMEDEDEDISDEKADEVPDEVNVESPENYGLTSMRELSSFLPRDASSTIPTTLPLPPQNITTTITTGNPLATNREKAVILYPRSNSSNTPTTRNESSAASNQNIDLSPLLVLRCFAPEGTPIQNRKYPISKQGATLGRRQSNTISFSHPVHRSSSSNGSNSDDIDNQQHQQQTYVGIDSSISGEHATIQYNEETDTLELFDGVNDRVSTNGTWIRLSPMHEESDWFTLDDKSEILIGTVRFQVTVEEVVVEKDLYD